MYTLYLYFIIFVQLQKDEREKNLFLIFCQLKKIENFFVLNNFHCGLCKRWVRQKKSEREVITMWVKRLINCFKIFILLLWMELILDFAINYYCFLDYFLGGNGAICVGEKVLWLCVGWYCIREYHATCREI